MALISVGCVVGLRNTVISSGSLSQSTSRVDWDLLLSSGFLAKACLPSPTVLSAVHLISKQACTIHKQHRASGEANEDGSNVLVWKCTRGVASAYIQEV